jgi:uncharacterized protein DUF6817
MSVESSERTTLNARQRRQVTFLLERGTAAISHSGTTLLVHLVNTRNLLNRWGARPALCDAGLYHSVYGTGEFGTGIAQWDERSMIRRLIGREAERLVFLFCRLSRKHFTAGLGESHRSVQCRLTGRRYRTSQDDIASLACISAANVIDLFPRMSKKTKLAIGKFLALCRPYVPPAARGDILPLCAW